MLKNKLRVTASIDKKIAEEFERMTSERSIMKSILIQKWIVRWVEKNRDVKTDIEVDE